MTRPKSRPSAAQMRQAAQHNTRQARDWLARYSPWSYVGLAAVSLFVMMFASGLHESLTVLWLLGYLAWWTLSTVLLAGYVLKHHWNQGTLSSGGTAAHMADAVRRQLPVWGVAYVLLLVDAIFNAELASNLFTFVVVQLVSGYLLRRQETLGSAQNRLRRAEANVHSEAAVEVPTAADPYAHIQDDQGEADYSHLDADEGRKP